MRLAESYLAALPLASAPLGRRAVAKIIDILGAAIVMGTLAWLGSPLFRLSLEATFPIILGGALVGGSILFAFYTVVAEYAAGHTLGKRLLGLRVVRESGAHISFGQAIVRQLQMFLQVFWFDTMFTLFTDRKRRALEVRSKTRTRARLPAGRELIRMRYPAVRPLHGVSDAPSAGKNVSIRSS